LFRSSFDGFRSSARETGDPIITTQPVPVARTQTQHRLRRRFLPALPAYLRPPTKLCRSGPAVIVEPVAVAIVATRQLVVCMVCTVPSAHHL